MELLFLLLPLPWALFIWARASGHILTLSEYEGLVR